MTLRIRKMLACLLMVSVSGVAATDDAADGNVERIGDARFRAGEVTFDSKTREIRIPAKVNMTEGLLEFLLVNEHGKIHEALFTTAASATHINLAFTLLRFPASRELVPLRNANGGASDKFPLVSDEVKKAARILIEIEWNENGETRRIPVSDWIKHTTSDKPMVPSPWVYSGSEHADGKYIPDLSGDLIGIFVEPTAILNYSGEDERNDEVWLPYPGRVPAKDTRVTLILSPFTKTTDKP